MVRYDVEFPTHNPTSPEGLPDELAWRVTLRLSSHLHAPLMRILDAVEGKSKAGHLLDLALTGAKLRYGLMDTPLPTGAAPDTSPPRAIGMASTTTNQGEELATEEVATGHSVVERLQERGISKGSIARFIGAGE